VLHIPLQNVDTAAYKQNKEDEMGGSCSARIQNFSRKIWRK